MLLFPLKQPVGLLLVIVSESERNWELTSAEDSELDFGLQGPTYSPVSWVKPLEF